MERFLVPTPFPVGGVNVYYLPGATPALIDTGTRTQEAERALTKALAGRSVERVVVTHGHVDHFGKAARLARELGAEVWVHEGDRRLVEGFEADAGKRRAAYGEGLRRAGVSGSELDRLSGESNRYDAWGEAVEVGRALRGGERIELGDERYEVIHAPGHSPGSILLRRVDGDHTFSGDTLLPRITPNALSVAIEERGALPHYLATLRRLARRRLGRIQPGHGLAFSDTKSVIQRALRHAELRQARILRVLGGEAVTARTIAGRLFLRLEPKDLFLALSETLGHLEVLIRAGRLDRDARGPVDSYRRVSGKF